MSQPPLPRHPRRLGFITFNVICLVLLVAWLVATPKAGLADLPNFALANVGMLFVLVAWVLAWLAWLVMVLRRWRHAQRNVDADTGAPTA